MKVFFTTTPRFKEDNMGNVKAIFKTIEELGYKHVSDYIVKVDVDEFYKINKEGRPPYYDEIMSSLKKAEIVVFEASLPSIGVGHLLNEALVEGKSVIALHLKDKFPFFLGGIKNDKLLIEEYNLDNLKELLKGLLRDAKDQIDVRFNFFIPPTIEVYLDWICKHKKLPRSVFLRKLIEDHMAKNKEYRA